MSDQPNPNIPSTQPQPSVTSTLQASSDHIHVVVRNRIKIIFEADAKSVSSQNDTGTFDVLPDHANFISIINETITIHTMDNQKETIPIKNGVIKVKGNTVHCYIDLLSS